MSITRARQHVQNSRGLIIQQIERLANEAGVDTMTMARALQEGFNEELGVSEFGETDPEEVEETVLLQLTGLYKFDVVYTDEEDRQNQIDDMVNELHDRAESLGVEEFCVDEV